VFTGISEAGVIVHSLVDHDPAQPDAEAMVQALLTAYPRAKVSVPQVQRGDLGARPSGAVALR